MNAHPKTIGESMKDKRNELGWSLACLAEKSGLNKNTIAGYEKDEHFPGLFNLVVLADTLGIGLDEYIGRRSGYAAQTENVRTRKF